MITKVLPVALDFYYMNDMDQKKEQKNNIVVTVKNVTSNQQRECMKCDRRCIEC